MGKHGGSRYRRSALKNKGSHSVILEAAFDGRGHRGGGPPQRTTIGRSISMTTARMGQAGGRDGFYCGHI